MSDEMAADFNEIADACREKARKAVKSGEIDLAREWLAAAQDALRAVDMVNGRRWGSR
jgi:phage shock protein A